MTQNMKKQIKKTTDKKEKSIVKISEGTDKEYPVWIFTNIDKAGKFAFDLKRTDFQHQEVLDKMINYSNMTWADIKNQTHDDGKSKHHIIEYQKLSKDAQDRIKAKKLEQDSDAIFSFALQNRLRIVGIKRGKEFHVLWYDPKHEACPSTKKHT